jgi:ribose transport system substrate-binding protein
MTEARATKLAVALVVAVGAMTVVFMLAAGSASSQEKIRVGLATDSLTQPAQAESHAGHTAEAKKQGVELIESHTGDPAQQASDIDAMLSRDLDVIAINPNDGKAIGASVQAANRANVPVVMWIGDNQGGGQTTTFITTNETLGGYQIAKAMFRKLRNRGEVAFVQGSRAHPAGVRREAGFRRALRETPNVKLVAHGATEWDPANADTLARDMLSKNPNIDAFIVAWDAGAQAVYQAVRGTPGAKAMISGYNGVCSTLNQIWKGQLTATLNQNWRGIGEAVIKTSVRVAKGQKVPKQIVLPSNVIDKRVMQLVLKNQYKGQTPSLTASVKAAVRGCK